MPDLLWWSDKSHKLTRITGAPGSHSLGCFRPQASATASIQPRGPTRNLRLSPARARIHDAGRLSGFLFLHADSGNCLSIWNSPRDRGRHMVARAVSQPAETTGLGVRQVSMESKTAVWRRQGGMECVRGLCLKALRKDSVAAELATRWHRRARHGSRRGHTRRRDRRPLSQSAPLSIRRLNVRAAPRHSCEGLRPNAEDQLGGENLHRRPPPIRGCRDLEG